MRAYKLRIGTIAGVMLVAGVSLAGIADDFKDASNRDGCEAIPYSSERSSCISDGRDVDDWCKNSSRPWSCDDLDPSGLNRNIDNVNSKISDLKKEKDDLEYKRNNAKDDSERRDLESQIKDKKEQIEALEAKVEAWKKQIDSEKSMARDRQDIGERCVANRITVQKLFASMKSKIQSETDPDAKQYVSRLVDKYTAAEKGHQDAIDFTTAASTSAKESGRAGDENDIHRRPSTSSRSSPWSTPASSAAARLGSAASSRSGSRPRCRSQSPKATTFCTCSTRSGSR